MLGSSKITIVTASIIPTKILHKLGSFRVVNRRNSAVIVPSQHPFEHTQCSSLQTKCGFKENFRGDRGDRKLVGSSFPTMHRTPEVGGFPAVMLQERKYAFQRDTITNWKAWSPLTGGIHRNFCLQRIRLSQNVILLELLLGLFRLIPVKMHSRRFKLWVTSINSAKCCLDLNKNLGISFPN